MAGSTFQTNPYDLSKLLGDCHTGVLQLPDFQRSWVWDEERIKSLIASISRAFPVGALMTLDTGGDVNFKPRPVEGAPAEAKQTLPHSLLLDGQQRMTSLYQVTLRGKVVETVTPKNKKVKRWFYIDIRKALDSTVDREEAIVGIPEDRVIRTDFGREVVLDLSKSENEYAALMYPVTQVFEWDEWQDGFDSHWSGDANDALRKTFREFKKTVLENFKGYRVPVISLDRSTSKEAVCVVFEKVNTGGKPLDAFELVTAMYAADGHELRKDWYGDDQYKGRHRRFVDTLRPADAEAGIIANISNTDFLQAISLFYTRERRREAERAGKTGKDLPAVIGNRQALLNLPLVAYKQYEKQVEQGFVRAAKFLHMQHIYRIFDLPYQSQIVPLAAILADLGEGWEHETNRAKLVRWYWNGVFGELYGSAVESRIARDFMEVPRWLQGGPEPSTVSETIFRADRLKTMRMRLSAAYKGVNALLMKEGAQDFRSGQKFDHTVFFGENVDIHHIFPQDWCKKKGIKPAIYDSIINKTPLSFSTNRIIGGVAPSAYLAKLEKGDKQTPAIDRDRLDNYLRAHLIDPEILRSDNFEAFMEDRQKRLLVLIEQATGKAAYTGDMPEEGVDVEGDADMVEAEMVIPLPSKANLMDPTEESIKTRVAANHWRVPSAERAFEGWLEGSPTEEERQQRIQEALKKRAVWKPSKEALQLVEQLKIYVGRRVRIQFWDPIMYLLDDEGPFPLEADCKDVVLLQDGDFLQAYLVIDRVSEVPTQDGYSPLRYLINRDNIAGQLAPLSELYEIWSV